MIPFDFFSLHGKNREKISSFLLSDTFNRPQMIENGDNIDKLIMGMLVQNMEDTDHLLVEDVSIYKKNAYIYDMSDYTYI